MKFKIIFYTLIIQSNVDFMFNKIDQTKYLTKYKT